MHKFRIFYVLENDDHDFIEIEMPHIPLKGEIIGLWIKDIWYLLTLDEIVHEFDEDNKYIITELNLYEK